MYDIRSGIGSDGPTIERTALSEYDAKNVIRDILRDLDGGVVACGSVWYKNQMVIYYHYLIATKKMHWKTYTIYEYSETL